MSTNVEQFVSYYNKAIDFLKQEFPDANPLQPGFLKEVAIAKELGHTVETRKHLCDAYDKKNRPLEYLTCQEDKPGKKRNFAIDGVFSSPEKYKQGSLDRIRRNHKIYYGIFIEGGLEIKELWEGAPQELVKLVDENVTKRDPANGGKNTEHTVCITKKWVRNNCKRII